MPIPSDASPHKITPLDGIQTEDGQSYMRDGSGRCLGPVNRMSPGPHTSTQRQSPAEINHAVIWFRPTLDTGRRLADSRPCRAGPGRAPSPR